MYLHIRKESPEIESYLYSHLMPTETSEKSSGERKGFSTNVLETPNIHIGEKRKRKWLLSHTTPRKWILDFNVNHKTTKLQEENRVISLLPGGLTKVSQIGHRNKHP